MARIRLDDAETLLLRRRYNGAIYMAGYAIECLLKWAVTSRTAQIYLPAELETHAWDVLLEAAGLYEDLVLDRSLQAVYVELADRWVPNFDIARRPCSKPTPKDFTTAWRYSMIGSESRRYEVG